MQKSNSVITVPLKYQYGGKDKDLAKRLYELSEEMVGSGRSLP